MWLWARRLGDDVRARRAAGDAAGADVWAALALVIAEKQALHQGLRRVRASFPLAGAEAACEERYPSNYNLCMQLQLGVDVNRYHDPRLADRGTAAR